MGKHGIRTVVGEKTHFHTSGFSKYTDKTLVYPDPSKKPEQFFEWLCETIVREQVDFLFPMDDDVMEIVVAKQEELSRLCHVPVPSAASYRVAADKLLTMRLAKERGVPHPLTVETSFGSDYSHEDLLGLVEGMTYPLVVKPRVSSGSRGVRFANNSLELVQLFQEVHQSYPNPLIQEAVPYGGKFGVCLCYDSAHQLRCAFTYKEVRNYPDPVGPSVVRESVYNEQLMNYTMHLMDGIPWHGVVEADYLIDSRSGQPKLMEINPRYWASLHLPIECGIDFPWMQYELGLGRNPATKLDYPEGVLGRQLLPGDLLYFLTSRKRWRMDPPFFSTKLHDDIISRDDPGPTAGFLVSALRYSIDPKMWKFVITR
jgi:predicted ATP-grasp superfamily ATP-dependent carboligase